MQQLLQAEKELKRLETQWFWSIFRRLALFLAHFEMFSVGETGVLGPDRPHDGRAFTYAGPAEAKRPGDEGRGAIYKLYI